jgi:hypothetical protein
MFRKFLEGTNVTESANDKKEKYQARIRHSKTPKISLKTVLQGHINELKMTISGPYFNKFYSFA